VVLDLCATLAARGHRVTLLTSDAADVPGGWLAGGTASPTVITLPGPGRFAPLLPGSSIERAAGALAACDVLHLHGAWEPANRQFARVARRIKVPYVVTAHGMLDDWSMAQRPLKKKLYLALGGQKFFERAAAVQCTARAELEQAQKHLGRSRGVVIPLLVDLAPFDELPGPEPAHAAFPDARTELPKVLFLSRLHPKKGIEVLISAAALLRQRGRPVRLMLAGSGDALYEAELRDRVRRQGLEDDVKFLGMVRGVEKVSLYQAADVFALPTSQENFGLVLPEAMACRTPVVTTRGVDIWQEIQSAGATIADATPAAFADAVAALLDDRTRRGQIGESGRRWVYETLAPETLLPQYEALYAGTA
jgi:glycosyltransferase involved in cell wall biosynthesis